MRGFSGSRSYKPDSVAGDHPSWQQPGPSTGHLIAGPVCLAPDGVWLAAVSPRRWWALTPPFHPCLGVSGDEGSPVGGFLSVPLSVGFRRLGLPQRAALRWPDFPRASDARGHPACVPNCSCVPADPTSLRSDDLHSGHVIRPPACSTNSPQTRHSRLTPRTSPCSSCSSVRWKAVM